MKIFANDPDNPLDAADMNHLSARVVNVYSTAAARDEAIADPFDGQLAFAGDTGLTVYNDGWALLVPIPTGGTTGQVLGKLSDADGDIGWVTPA